MLNTNLSSVLLERCDVARSFGFSEHWTCSDARTRCLSFVVIFVLVVFVRAVFVKVVLVVDVHEVFNVFEEVVGVSADIAGNIAREDSTDDRDGEGGEQSSQLVATLLLEGSSVICLGEDDGSGFGVGPCLVGEGCADGTAKSAQNAWNSVEVQHSAGVVQMEAFGVAKTRGQVSETGG